MYGHVPALTIALVTWSVSMTSSSGEEPEQKHGVAKKLYDAMLVKEKYNKLIRPVGKTSESLTVNIGLRLTSIIDVVREMRKFTWHKFYQSAVKPGFHYPS